MYKILTKRILIILFIFFVNNIVLYSQEFDLKILPFPDILKSVDIPSSFKRSEKTFECFDGKGIGGCFYILGYSSDEEFAVLMYGPVRMIVQDSIDFMDIRSTIDTLCMIMGAEPPAKEAPSPETLHRITMNLSLNHLLQREWNHEISPEEYEKYVSYYPEEYARSKFNADSAVTYKYWAELEKEPYQGKYIGCQALLLQKHDKGHLVLHCFYTEKGSYRIREFMKEFEGIVWFND
jgi:hypothetical protein